MQDFTGKLVYITGGSGRITPFFYFFHRLTNGRITRIVSDIVVRIARRK